MQAVRDSTEAMRGLYKDYFWNMRFAMRANQDVIQSINHAFNGKPLRSRLR